MSGPAVPEATPTATMDQAARLRALVAAAGPQRPLPGPPARAAEPLARTIAITSGKGGVGKTTTAVNLAIAMARLGRRTTLLDADLGMANADVLCGLSPVGRLDRIALGDGRSVRQLGVGAPGGFTLIPGAVGGGRMADPGALEISRLLHALEELRRDADVALVDTGAGIGRGVLSLVGAADLALVVVTPDPASITDAYALIKCVVRQAPARGLRSDPRPVRIGIVVNQAPTGAEAAGTHDRLAAACDRFLKVRPALLGWVPHDAEAARAARSRRPLMLSAPQSAASRALDAVAKSLVQELRIGRARPAGWRLRWPRGRKMLGI